MRTPRTEIISIDAERLAQHAFAHHYAQVGLVCVHAAAVADGKHTLLTVCSVASPDKASAPGYYWFRSQRDADKVFHEMATLEAMPWIASRVDNGVLVEVAIDCVGAVIAECLKWQWTVKLVTGAELEARIVSVEQEVERWLVRLQCTGVMKTINQQYKALRAKPRAEGEKFPSYKIWATKRLEQQVLQQVAAGRTAAELSVIE